MKVESTLFKLLILDSTTFVGTIKDVEVSILNYTVLTNNGICCTVAGGEECILPNNPLYSVPISFLFLLYF